MKFLSSAGTSSFARLIACCLGCLALLSAGCGKSDREAKDWAYAATNVLGTFETQTPVRLARVVQAVDGAMKELEYFKGQTDNNGTEAVLTYRGRGDTQVTVKLKQFADYTNIKVRCGLLGEEAQARDILARIYKQL